MVRPPVFIGGMYKSGTSLLRAMLGRHSELFAGLETQWLHEEWGSGESRARDAWIQRMAVFFDASPDEFGELCRDVSDVETCLDRLMRRSAARAGKSRWIEKTPGNAGAIGRILGHWPTAHVLHITRDPRDVYASLVENRKWTAPEEFADKWCDTVGAARNWLASVGGAHPQYHELRYERLVLAPEVEMEQVLDFLDERWEPEVGDFPGQAEDFERVRQATGKESSTLRRLAQPLTTARVGVWESIVPAAEWAAVRRELDRREVGHIAEELMARPEDDPVEHGGARR